MIVGGAGRWALHTLEREYDNPAGGDAEVRLWESDQGYFCRERNILTDVDEVLRIALVFYQTASVESLSCFVPR